MATAWATLLTFGAIVVAVWWLGNKGLTKLFGKHTALTVGWIVLVAILTLSNLNELMLFSASWHYGPGESSEITQQVFNDAFGKRMSKYSHIVDRQPGVEPGSIRNDDYDTAGADAPAAQPAQNGGGVDASVFKPVSSADGITPEPSSCDDPNTETGAQKCWTESEDDANITLQAGATDVWRGAKVPGGCWGEDLEEIVNGRLEEFKRIHCPGAGWVVLGVKAWTYRPNE